MKSEFSGCGLNLAMTGILTTKTVYQTTKKVG